jgi:nucleoid DNA-binding protein
MKKLLLLFGIVLLTGCSTLKVQQRNERICNQFKAGTYINVNKIQLLPFGYPDDNSNFNIVHFECF